MFQNRYLISYVILLFICFTSLVDAQTPEGPVGTKVYKIRAKLTAYCTCKKCCERFSAGKKTALGTDARKTNGVAVARALIPLGSHVFIPGLRSHPLRLADDTGKGMRDAAKAGYVKIDVRMDTHANALLFGKRTQDVYVILDDPTDAQNSFFALNSLFSWSFPQEDPSEVFLAAVAANQLTSTPAISLVSLVQ